MGGTQMAMKRWCADAPFYRNRPLILGDILDIGPGYDPLSRYAELFPLAESWTCLDHTMQEKRYGAEWIEGDATEGAVKLYPRQFNVVFSSHSLEHMVDPAVSLQAWWNLVKPGGHLIMIVPSWKHYERLIWPPNKNHDHRSAWVLYLQETERPVLDMQGKPFIRGLINEAAKLEGGTILRAITLDTGWIEGERDQTSDETCESGHEIVVEKLS